MTEQKKQELLDEIKKLEKEIKNYKKQNEKYKKLNANLLRMHKEFTNKERGLSPKKHTGYIALFSKTKPIPISLIGKKMQCWKTSFQTPYSIAYLHTEVKETVISDFFKNFQNQEPLKYKVGFHDYKENSLNEFNNYYVNKTNVVFDINISRNFKAGFYEVAFFHVFAIEDIPKDMLNPKIYSLTY